jgi:NADH dehydrogenase
MRQVDGKKRVLILGGGFGGVTAAQRLQKHFKKDAGVEITLVNRDNFFVFVPLLASAASGSIETLHILNPIRRMIPGVNFRAEEILNVDLRRHEVITVSPVTGREARLGFDHLILGLGNTINLATLPGVAQHGKTMKSLGDALHLRNHVISMLEAADVETDPRLRQELLTFVVAGAGYSGVETVGELNDLVHGVAKSYPSITRDSLKVILLHSRDRILPEMGAGLADFALKKLRQRGVEVRLQTKITAATPHEAILNTGERIPTRTLVVTVGSAINPVLASLQLPREKERILTDGFMGVPGLPGVWALGDNAAVPNAAANSEFSPPTAQYALRQGKRLGDNLAALLRGEPQTMKPFSFPGLGQLCLVGHRAGVAELMGGIKLSGFIAWMMWRNVYLSKLPGWDRKVRVGLDWSLDLVFPRELAQLNLGRTQVMNQAHYEPGDLIFRQGDVGDIFYVITSGEVELFKQLPNGQQIPAARLGQGEHFGESALISGRRRSVTARAVGPVDLLCLGRDDFNSLAGAWLKFLESVQELSKDSTRAFSGSNPEVSRDLQTILGTIVQHPQFAGAGLATPAAPIPMPLPPAPVLPPVLVRGDGAELPLQGDLITIGRAPENNIVIDDKQVSRRHAIIKREAKGYILEDSDTANGTYVNQQRIKQVLLNEGDYITFGRVSFTYKNSRNSVLQG